MIDTEIRIGKNILENLTTGMYPDSRFIYREYIQNAADAKAYDDLLEKSKFLEDSHQQLIALFKRYMLLDDRISNIKLSEESKTHIINEARAILHKENQQFAIGKTFVEKSNDNYCST